ncbi:MAG: hypothetical protein RR327_08115 [Clostridia bacterium]
MYLKQSIGVLVSNFSLCYKVLLYKVIVGLIIIAIAVAIFLPSFLPVFQDLEELGVINMCKEVFEKVATFKFVGEESLAVSFDNILNLTSDVLVNHANTLMTTYIGTAVLILIAFFLNSFSQVPTAEVLYGAMELQAKYYFTSSILTKSKISLTYSLLSMVLLLPIDIIIFGICALILFGGGFKLSLFLPALAILAFTFLMSLRKTFSSIWLGVIVGETNNVWKAFKISLKYVGEDFSRIFSTCIITTLFGNALCFGLGIFSLGVSFILTPSIYITLECVLSLVIFFNLRGKRFYINENEIITPKKLQDREQSFSFDLK